jgi:SPP1 gp7 family putative phage head morphogenesis protein
MTYLDGLTFDELDVESDAFADLVSDGITFAIVHAFNNIEFIVAASKHDPEERRKFYTSENMSFIPYFWKKYVKETITPYLYNILNKSVEAITTNIKKIWPGLSPEKIDVKTQSLIKHYVNQATQRMNDVSDVLTQRVREQLTEGIKQNETIPQLRDRIMAGGNLTRARAESIARTEVIAANNMGSLVQVQELGGVGTKTWLSKIDDRTRETHKHADDQTVKINQEFTVGFSRLSFPGDPSGPPGEIINCRCTLTYDVEFFSLEKSKLRL